MVAAAGKIKLLAFSATLILALTLLAIYLHKDRVASRFHDHDPGRKAWEQGREAGTTMPQAEQEGEAGRTIDMHDETMVQDEDCEPMGMVRYHGRCMTVAEKTACVELEIRHVQRLLDESYALHRTGSPEDVAILFKQTEDFMSRFDLNETMNKHIEEKLLLLLGFLYLAADRIAKEMKQELLKQTEIENPIAVLEGHKRFQSFSTEVHVPLMSVLAKRINAYVSRNGEEEFSKLMTDNALGGVLRQLE